MGAVMSSRLAAELDHALERNGWCMKDVKALAAGDVLSKLRLVILGLAEVVTVQYPVSQSVKGADLSAERLTQILNAGTFGVTRESRLALEWLIANRAPLKNKDCDFVLLTHAELGLKSEAKSPTLKQIADHARALGLRLCDPRHVIALASSAQIDDVMEPLIVMSRGFVIRSMGEAKCKFQIERTETGDNLVSRVFDHYSQIPVGRGLFIFRV